MIKSLFNPISSTYFCNNCTPDIHSDNNPLYLVHVVHRQAHILCSPILFFNLSSFLNQSITIHKANILFPIQSMDVCSCCFPNELTLSIFAIKDMPETISRDALPSSILKIKVPITRNSPIHRQININITSFIPIWRKSPSLNYGFMLSVKNADFEMEICNNSYINSPKLRIEYEKSPLPVSDPFSAIQLMSTVQNGCCLNPNEFIHFDKPKENIATDILYDPQTGQFSFKTPGLYYLQWIINLTGTGAMEYISISLNEAASGIVYRFCSLLIEPGQISGHHLLEVKNTMEHYSLINSCTDKIQLSKCPLQASLIIFKISS